MGLVKDGAVAVPSGSVAAPVAKLSAPNTPARIGGEGKASVEKQLSREEYWTRREERDIANGLRANRSGAYQAAIQSMGLLQLNVSNTLEDYLKLVEKAADAIVAYSRREDTGK